VHRNRFSTPAGRRITEMIFRARASQGRVAHLLGLPKSTFNQMVTGRITPPADLEARVRRALGLGVGGEVSEDAQA
jgi:DNA-binding transcriptional regulator YdaS (Cro superfamily)